MKQNVSPTSQCVDIASLMCTVFVAILAFQPMSGVAQSSLNSALSFDGMDDLVIVANHPLLELTDGTLELWFKPDWAVGSLGYDPLLIGNREGISLTRYSVHLERNLNGVMLANGNGVSTLPYTFVRRQWYHLR